MYSVEEIRHVHLEISSRCNASCPLCPRNFFGYPYNDGYVERDLTLKDVMHIFQPEFIEQLDVVYINGNFGDAVMNPETVDIVNYFRKNSSRLLITMSTNAGARDRDYWQALAHSGVQIYFCIDGLEDTHSLYRQNTLYSTVIRNAKTFIAAGGHAIWKMIDFDHNRHQQAVAEELSKELGFKSFILVDHGRNQGPVFNQHKELVHVMGNPDSTEFEVLWRSRTQDEVLLEDVSVGMPVNRIDCKVKKGRSVYIDSTGNVYPCCFLGFNPESYGRGNYLAVANQQIRPLVKENNALTHSLAHCLTWFSSVENTWNIPSFKQGRLMVCNNVCGQA